VESQKTLVTKVVGHGKMHIYAKNGVKIRKFTMELAQTMVNWVESQVKSCLMPFFVKSFSYEILVWHVWYFSYVLNHIS
jgi:hypothetical protein